MGAYELSTCPADIAPTCPISGDCGCGDGIIGPLDLAALLANWDPNTANPCADIAPVGAPDGIVGPADLAELLARWGACGTESLGGGGDGPSAPGNGNDGAGSADDSDAAIYEWALNATIDDLLYWLETGDWSG